jgi:putative transposase
MIRNHHLARSIADAGWAQFVRLVSYKVDWAGGTVLKADRFFASSKLCSVCGERNESLTLHERVWVCGICKTTHGRDQNAAINLSKLPLEQGKVTPVEIRVPVGARPRKPMRPSLG